MILCFETFHTRGGAAASRRCSFSLSVSVCHGSVHSWNFLAEEMIVCLMTMFISSMLSILLFRYVGQCSPRCISSPLAAFVPGVRNEPHVGEWGLQFRQYLVLCVVRDHVFDAVGVVCMAEVHGVCAGIGDVWVRRRSIFSTSCDEVKFCMYSAGWNGVWVGEHVFSACCLSFAEMDM